MVTKLPEVDAVMVGMGFTGGILAKELTMAGLNVVGLERGPDRRPQEEFVLPRIRDELRFVNRIELMGDNSVDTITFRNSSDQTGLPHRRNKRKDLFSVHHSLFTIHFITAPIYNFRDNFFLQIGWPVQNW